MILLDEASFLVTDVETTGSNPVTNRVMDIGCVLLRKGNVEQEFESLVNPCQHIPLVISRLTGITDAMVFNAPDSIDVFLRLKDFLAEPNAVFVAHNVNFDWSFVRESFVRARVQAPPATLLCTYKLAKYLLPNNKKYSVGALATYFGITIIDRHRAMGDARATASILLHLLDIARREHGVSTVEELLSLHSKRTETPKTISSPLKKMREKVRALPKEPGIYYFRDANNTLLYIGKAKALRTRVASYFQKRKDKSQKIKDLVKQIVRIDVEPTGTELSALLIESKEIKLHRPRYNTLIKRYRNYPFIRVPLNEPFPKLYRVMEIANDGADYFGPFPDRGVADAVIDIVNKVFGVRQCNDEIHPSDTNSPCIYNQIGQCGAPCANKQSQAEYLHSVEQVRTFLSGENSDSIIEKLTSLMTKASDSLQFEEAALLRDRINVLKRIFYRQQKIAASINENNAVLVLPTAGTQSKVELFLIRHGRLRYQRIIGKKIPFKELQQAIADTFFDGSSAPKHCRKEEIDEMRIIANWMYRNKDQGTFLYTADLTQEHIVEQTINALYFHLNRAGNKATQEQSPQSK